VVNLLITNLTMVREEVPYKHDPQSEGHLKYMLFHEVAEKTAEIMVELAKEIGDLDRVESIEDWAQVMRTIWMNRRGYVDFIHVMWMNGNFLPVVIPEPQIGDIDDDLDDLPPLE